MSSGHRPVASSPCCIIALLHHRPVASSPCCIVALLHRRPVCIVALFASSPCLHRRPVASSPAANHAVSNDGHAVVLAPGSSMALPCHRPTVSGPWPWSCRLIMPFSNSAPFRDSVLFGVWRPPIQLSAEHGRSEATFDALSDTRLGAARCSLPEIAACPRLPCRGGRSHALERLILQRSNDGPAPRWICAAISMVASGRALLASVLFRFLGFVVSARLGTARFRDPGV